MFKMRRMSAAAAVLAVGALLLTGCTSGGATSPTTSTGGAALNAAVASVVNPSTKAGGTLKLLATVDCDSWDPSQTYYGWCLNMNRLYSRTLVNYSKVNGTDFKLAPDLATDLGQHSADFKTWTYTLKSGLKFSTGAAITPKDLKYGIERLYATDLQNGPGFYFTSIIDAPASYKGPYTSGDLPQSAISTTATTITFHLKKAFADFNYLLALPTSAPVPYKTEGGAGFTGQNYTKKPVSSGPYVITSYSPLKSVTFERNKYWSQSTDTIRKPLVDTIDLTIDSNADDVGSKLKAGDADALADSSGLPSTFQAQAFSSPTLTKQVDDPGTQFTGYYSIPSSVIPNKDCRLAIAYAMNKKALVVASGGTAAGVVAGSMTPPGIPGYDASYNPYPTGKDSTGDVAKAKDELQKCGKPSGFTVKVSYRSDVPASVKRFAVMKQALARAGITAEAASSTSEKYYSTFVGVPTSVKSQGIGVIDNGWGADFPTLFGFYQSIVNGAAIKPAGNYNDAEINDPTINGILDATDKPSTDAAGKQLNEALMATAQNIPYRFGKTSWFRSTRMTNVTCDNALAFGAYDWVNVGVK